MGDADLSTGVLEMVVTSGAFGGFGGMIETPAARASVREMVRSTNTGADDGSVVDIAERNR